jgi:transglutaminase-like putative cysteine protease
MEDISTYLHPTPAVESDHPRIVALCRQLGAGTTDERERARRLFRYVRDTLAYSLHNPMFRIEHYRATAVLDRGRGFCVQKAVVLCALARAAGIPARLIFADIINHRAAARMREVLGGEIFVYHCYVEMHLGDGWLQMTPSFERSLCEEHGYPLVDFNGKDSAIFPPTDAAGRPFVAYLRHHGRFADVPLLPMLAAWETAYGKAQVDLWRRTFPDR